MLTFFHFFNKMQRIGMMCRVAQGIIKNVVCGKIKNGLELPTLQMTKNYLQIRLNFVKNSVVIHIIHQQCQLIRNVVSLIGIILVEIAIFLVIMTKIITLKLATMLDVTSLVD